MREPVRAEPRRQRSEGRIALEVRRWGERSGVAGLAEAGPLRLRLPRTDGTPEGVIVNTAGGLACGDDMQVEVRLHEGADFVLTAAAAEKVYRSTGPVTTVATRIALAREASLCWLPQASIVFDRARLRRRLEVDLDPSAECLLFEATVFGRLASGESVREGLFEDRWRVRRGGRLVHADTLRLEGGIAARLAHPAVAHGRCALATLLYCAPDAESRLDEARDCLADVRSECGASAWDGRLVVRWLAPDLGTLHRDAARFMTAFRGRPLPRVWHL